MKANLVLFTLAVGGALLLSGCTAPDNGNDAILVEMNSPNKFEPETVTIEPGTTVVWINRDSTSHNVVSDDGAFEGMDPNKMLRGGQQFEFTFTEPGIYSYHCEPHAFEQDGEYRGMVGTVIVLNEDGSTPEATSDDGDGGNNTGNETA